MGLIYAGIGSRQTPLEVLNIMQNIGQELADNWTLRSGYADGADNAFYDGADLYGGKMEIYIPWAGFNGAIDDDARFIVPVMNEIIMAYAAQFHPNWNACSQGAKRLHARNVCQILGEDLSTPATMVICWTPNGSGSGGTGQALRIAKHHNIPIFDLAIPANEMKLCEFVNQKENSI